MRTTRTSSRSTWPATACPAATPARAAVPANRITLAYNGDDELTSQTSSLSGTTNDTYDPNGSLTTSTKGGVTTTYTYDARNKMVGYSSGSVVAAYVYDDAGN